MTSAEFARRIGVHFTMGSRLRSGKRMPSVATLAAIILEFDLTGDELAPLWLSVLEAGGESSAEAEAFGEWLRHTLFTDEEVNAA